MISSFRNFTQCARSYFVFYIVKSCFNDCKQFLLGVLDAFIYASTAKRMHQCLSNLHYSHFPYRIDFTMQKLKYPENSTSN